MKQRPSRRPCIGWAACLLAAGWLVAGCAIRPYDDMLTGPAYQPANIYGQAFPFPSSLRRVAVLPLSVGRSDLDAGQEMLDSVVQDELGQAKRFEVVRVRPEQLQAWTGRKSWSTAQVLPENLLVDLRDKLGCDAVMFAELSQFQAYPPLTVGLNLKLVDARSGQILWAADEVFDAGQPAVANGARRYQMKHSPVGGPLADSRFILLSPSAFGHYAAQTLFATLPARPPS
jgi:hypothetical protein